MPHADCLIIWITGASSGIGAALAKEFSKLNVVLILTARRQQQLQQVQAQLHNCERHLVLALDITDAHALAKATSKIIQEYGRIDYLINNAGVSQNAHIAETTEHTHRQLMEVGFFAPTQLTRCVLPYMERQGSGKIVFVSSMAGLLGTPYRASYCAAKAALHTWANTLRSEYAEKGIKVAVIYPGYINTNAEAAALAGDGSPVGHVPEAVGAMCSKQFARRALHALLHDQEYIVIGGLKERMSIFLTRIWPTLTQRVGRQGRWI